MGARLLPQSYQYPNFLEGADRVGGQLCRDKECPFSGVTKSGRVWRKVPESDAQRVTHTHIRTRHKKQKLFSALDQYYLNTCGPSIRLAVSLIPGALILPDIIVITNSADSAPNNTVRREWRIAKMAAMKKVLSPISETMMTDREATRACRKPKLPFLFF